MNAEQLNERIKIKRFVETPDGSGGFSRSTEAAETVATVWAKVEKIRGDEQTTQDRVQGVATYRFTIWNQRSLGLKDSDFVEWQGRTFNVRFAPPFEHSKQFYTFDAETGVAQ